MHTTQTTLTDDPDDHDNTSTAMSRSASEREPSSNAQTNLAPPDQRGGDGCCPWCLAAPETFKHHDDGTVGCGYCDAAIPVGAEWYERGEKIAI